MNTKPSTRSEQSRRSRDEIDRDLVAGFNALLKAVRPTCPLYREKLADCPEAIHSLEDLQRFPLTTKADLQSEDGGPGPNLTYPLERYCRFHQTSGTTGRPLMVFDTPEDWVHWIESWQWVLDSAEVTEHDRVMMAFSYGPFIGFWAAHDAVVARGCLVLPGGGMTSMSRLAMIQNTGATVLMCTPSYALHLAELAAEQNIDLTATSVRKIIVAGEPGGSLSAVRARIEKPWAAEVIDHSGASEVGAWGFADRRRTGLHINEAQFLAEYLRLSDGQPAAEGELAELVLTNLLRPGFPVIRYRTGDLVRPIWKHDLACRYVLLEGGVLGRADDMMIVRGVNIFPTAIEQIVRTFDDVLEYRVTATRVAEMDQLEVEVEDTQNDPARVAAALRTRLGLRIDVRCVPPGTLPRFEAKGRRFVDRRKDTTVG